VTLLELAQTLFGILQEISEKENSQPHVVAHYVIDDRINFELCPVCAKGGTEKIVLRVEGPCSDSLVMKAFRRGKHMTKPQPTIDEVEYGDQFFKSYCDNLKKFVVELLNAGLTRDQLNTEVLPKCTELYNRVRKESMESFRHAAELNELDDGSIKH
jgi:hypothetical protein